MLRRLPIRTRVTLVFAGAMALLLVALGAFLYLRLDAQITETVDTGLEARAGELTARLEASSVTEIDVGAVAEGDESFAQVLGVDGEVVASTAQLSGRASIGEPTLSAAANGPTFAEIAPLPGLEGSFRVLAVPAGDDRVTVVGASLDDRNEALSNLLVLLLIGGPVSLLLASLAGYAAISTALRPVEAMRARASEIGAESTERLPVGVADDELRRLAETLNAMLDRLETAIERERRFVDDASHELRTPLALHKTALELALRYESDDPGLREAVASSIEDVDRLTQLAEDLLVVARSEAGELAINRERVRVRPLLESVATRFEARAGEAGRRIEVAAPADLEVEADPLRIEQALTNMVDNALRHGKGAVGLRAEAGDGAVRLRVDDEGTGFGDQFLPTAFERFSRADPARTSGGSGLGLAIVETIARAHGGRAGADDGPVGPDVWIELPRA